MLVVICGADLFTGNCMTLAAAGLQKDVVLVGMADKFEIWDQARFDALLVEDVSDEVAACHLDIAL